MDEFERELSEFLQRRVAAMPAEYGAPPALVHRARRRRRAKRVTLVVSVFVLASGTTAAVAQVAGRDGPRRIVTTPDATTSTTSTTATLPTTTSTSAPPTSTSTTTGPAAGAGTVLSVACPITYALTPNSPLPPPSTAPRAITAETPEALAGLQSYAATTDPRFVVLAPKGSSCQATIAADGQNGVAIWTTTGMHPAYPGSAPISVINDYLWHGGVGSAVACSVFDDPAIVAYVTSNYPQLLPCPKAGRTVTRIDDHVATFEDADGTVGVGLIVLPTGLTQEDGKLSVLTCHPSAGLTADECDTIVADFEARVRAELVAP